MALAENNSRFVIEAGLPMPRRAGGRSRIYPFPGMKVGDSFAIPFASRDTVRTAASWYGTRHKMKFSVQKDGEGFRVWRTK